jgi:hypothetical protein
MRDRPEIRTFRAFFMDLVRAHGPLLNGVPAVFLPPDAKTPARPTTTGARADAALPGRSPLRYCRSDVYGCPDC